MLALKYKLLWIFDNAPSHRKKNEDALNVYHMNLNPGGKAKVMHDTHWIDSKGKRRKQSMSKSVWVEADSEPGDQNILRKSLKMCNIQCQTRMNHPSLQQILSKKVV